MQNEFWEKTRVAKINSNFSFIGQTRLEHSAFSTVGVQNFATKIMVFLRRSLHIEMQPYNAEEFVSMDELKKRIAEVRKMKHRLRLQLDAGVQPYRQRRAWNSSSTGSPNTCTN